MHTMHTFFLQLNVAFIQPRTNKQTVQILLHRESVAHFVCHNVEISDLFSSMENLNLLELHVPQRKDTNIRHNPATCTWKLSTLKTLEWVAQSELASQAWRSTPFQGPATEQWIWQLKYYVGAESLKQKCEFIELSESDETPGETHGHTEPWKYLKGVLTPHLTCLYGTPGWWKDEADDGAADVSSCFASNPVVPLLSPPRAGGPVRSPGPESHRSVDHCRYHSCCCCWLWVRLRR